MINPSWGVSVLFAVIATVLISVDVSQRNQEIKEPQELEASKRLALKTATDELWHFNSVPREDGNFNTSFDVKVDEDFFKKIKQGSLLTFNTPFNNKTYSVVLQESLSAYPNIKSFNSQIINGESFERVLISKGERLLQISILSKEQRYHVQLNVLNKQGIISLERANQIGDGQL